MGKPAARVKRRRLHSGARFTVYLRARPGWSYSKVTAHDVQALIPTQPRPDVPVPMVLMDHMGVLPEEQPDKVRHHQLVLGWLEVLYRPS